MEQSTAEHTISDRLALAVCTSTGAAACRIPCRICRRNSAAVAQEVAAVLRERYGSSVDADWLDGVGCHG